MFKKPRAWKKLFPVISVALILLLAFCVYGVREFQESKASYHDLSENEYRENAHAVASIMMQGFRESKQKSYMRALEDVYHDYSDKIKTYITAKSQIVDYWDFLDKEALKQRKIEIGENTSTDDWNRIHDENGERVREHLPNAFAVIENEEAIAAHSFKYYRVIYYNSGNFDLEPIHD